MQSRMRLPVWLAKRMLAKVNKSFQNRHGHRLPIILVTGTAGKSSVTLLLKQLFEADGWSVFTGVTPQAKSLNSITGLSMVLGGFSVDFEHGNSLLKKIWFVFRCFWFLWFESYTNFGAKTIIIHEVGYDHQNESYEFQQVFQNGVDLLITTAMTYEHSGAFTDNFNVPMFLEISEFLPKKVAAAFEDPGIDTRLKNIALEQLSLLQIASSYILPASLGKIDNWVVDNLGEAVRTHQVASERVRNFALRADASFTFSDRYLLPQTFAKTAYILSIVCAYFGIEPGLVQPVLQKIELPNGRFSMLEGILQTTLVDSTYNSDPQSLSGFLDQLEEVLQASKEAHGMQLLQTENRNAAGEPPKHYIILGEMRELGDTSLQAHKEVLDRLISIGKQWGPYLENIFLLGTEWVKCDDDGIVKVEDQVGFISYNKQLFKVFKRAGDMKILLNEDTIRPRSWVWLKGSQNTIFLEIMVEHLLAHKEDAQYLCRRGKKWDMIRKPWL